MGSIFDAQCLRDGPMCIYLRNEQSECVTPVGLKIYSTRTVEFYHHADSVNGLKGLKGAEIKKRATSCCIVKQTPTCIVLVGIVDGDLVRWCFECETFAAHKDYNGIGDFLPRKTYEEIKGPRDLLIGSDDSLDLVKAFDLIDLCTSNHTDTGIVTGEDNEAVQLAAMHFKQMLQKVHEKLVANIHSILIDGMETDAAMKDYRQQQYNEWIPLRDKIESAISLDELGLGVSQTLIPHVAMQIDMPAEYALLNNIQDMQDDTLEEFIVTLNDEEIEEEQSQ